MAMTYQVIGIGELLWDLLPTGRQMGGAPANFAYHARALGADGRVISRVGQDALGAELIERLGELGVPTGGISVDPTYPTGTVTVEVSADGQPTFTIHEGVAWDHLEATPALLAELARADAVCFGTLAQRCEASRAAIRSLVGAAPRSAVRIFDINLRQRFYSRELIEESLALSNVVKLNDTELPVVADLLALTGSDEAQLAQLAERYHLRFVACTRGAKGSLLYDGTRIVEQPGLQVAVRDTVGAGDAFTAAVALGLLAGWDVEKIGSVANEIAAYVCSCAGATPPLPATLRQFFERNHDRSHAV